MEIGQDVRLPGVFDDLDVGITVHHPETGAILDVNERLEELYGYSAPELRELSVGEYTAASTQFSQAEAVRRIRAAANGDPQRFEWHVKRRNGELVWVSVSLTDSTLSGTPVVIAEIREVTDSRNRERRFQLLNRILRHNLRNEMNILAGYADQLKAALDADSLAEQAATIKEIANNVGGLSESLRQLEAIVDTDTTDFSPLNLQTVVHDRVVDVREQYPDADLSVDAPDDVWVSADEGLSYALDQALENALEHNDADVPSVSVFVTATQDEARIEIVDDGPPIPEVEIDVLDEEVERDTTYHGSGVGLWVMKWCLQSLGGQLSFDRTTPDGNVVSFSLPRISPKADD